MTEATERVQLAMTYLRDDPPKPPTAYLLTRRIREWRTPKGKKRVQRKLEVVELQAPSHKVLDVRVAEFAERSEVELTDDDWNPLTEAEIEALGTVREGGGR